MVNWTDINPNFTEELVLNWQNRGFDFEQVKKWIERGFSPDDYQLADFARGNLEYNAETALSREEIGYLRSIYQNDFNNQAHLLSTNSNEQDVIMQTIISQNNEKLLSQSTFWEYQSEEFFKQKKEIYSDMGWLTDDNIEYILKNDETTQGAKDIQIRTDIANIYLQVEKTKRGGIVDDEFWNSLDISKRYIILPLRVRGNHWGLLFFVNDKKTNKVLWARYISSHPSPKEVSEEVKELEGFLKQALKRYGNNCFNDDSLKSTLLQEVPKQRNTWDCGIYLIKFIKFLTSNEYHELKDLIITDQEIKEFREEWKKRIGEENWCKWDEEIPLIIKEVDSVEKKQPSEEELIVEEDKKNDDNLPLLWKKEMEDEMANLKADFQKLATFCSRLFVEFKKVQGKNKQLEKNQELLKKEIFQLKFNELQEIEKRLKEMVDKINNQLKEEDDKELLAELLEAQQELILNKHSFASKQVERYKNRLIKKGICEGQIKEVYEMQIKLEETFKQLEQEAKIEVKN